MRKTLYMLLAGSAIVAFSGWAWARSGSYMGASTGGPGEADCTDCHSGVADAGSGAVWLLAPSEYVPDDTLDLVLGVENTGMRRWGFEITVLDASNQPAGQFVITDAMVTQDQTAAGTGRQYVFQTSEGTYDGIADTSWPWTFRWAAPGASTGSVTFWLAGLAANGTGGTGGDSTYTASYTLTESITVGVGDDGESVRPLGFTLAQNYPNPFNPATEIGYHLSHPAMVELSIYNIVGERVRVLENAHRPAGEYRVLWDGRTEAGRTAGSGVYLYRLSVDGSAQMRKMVLLK